MATQIIHFITWNVNGLKQNREQKCRELHNTDVVFLQETHIGEEDECIVKGFEEEWNIFFTQYSSSQKGTAILVRKTLDFEYIRDYKDTCGGYVVLKCKLEGQLYTLVSVYNHQTDTTTLNNLSRYLQLMATGLLVIGGDFNTVLNPFIDKKCNTNNVINNRSHSKQRSSVENFMKSLQLVDIWRRKNPSRRNYTYCTCNAKSRLDYFFVPEECLWRIRNCEISSSTRRDHRPVSLKINNVPILHFHEDPQAQSVFQQFELKKEVTNSSFVQKSTHAVSEVDIVLAVQSLQVSETLRPDGIPASFYKDINQDIISYLKVLFDRIHSGSINCSETDFNKSVEYPPDSSQHFFNVDYLILATILARRLDNFLESQSQRRIPKDSATVLITSKTLWKLRLSRFKDELEKQIQSNPIIFQDFCIMKNLLRDAEEDSLDRGSVDISTEKYKLLCQGCPLTSVLTSLALKCHASKLFGHLKEHEIFVFKESVIVCFQPKDLDDVKATVENELTIYKETYDIVISGANEGESEVGEESTDSEYEPMEVAGRSAMYALIILQESEEVMVAASNWLRRDETCYWPPFKSTEKYLEAVKNRLEPETAGKKWEILSIQFHSKYDTYEEALKKQEELTREQKDGLTKYAVVSLEESNELTVVPTKWLTEQKTQCYWPPFKSPENFTEAVKNRLESTAGGKPWEMLQIQVHKEFVTYEQAMKMQKAMTEQKELPGTPSRMSSDVTIHGIKRKRDYESSVNNARSTLTTDLVIRERVKQIILGVNNKVQAAKDTNQSMTTLNAIRDAISRMDNMDKEYKRKATIGVFGKTGVGKSSLLNAVMGENFLLPSGSYGACTAVIVEVEANLSDSNYTAEIISISKEEWEKEISDKSEDSEEMLIALFGSGAHKKTLQELNRDHKDAEIDNLLSSNKKTISNSNRTDFLSEVKPYIENCECNPGGRYWPLVKSVTIKIPNCTEILEHIVLVDVPGTGDCNKIRNDLWKSALRRCSSVWIVSDIKRAITETDPWAILNHSIQDLGPGGECKTINFICTKTDDINSKEYVKSARLPKEMEGDKRKCILHRNNCAKEAVKRRLENAEIKDSKGKFITDVFTVSSTAFFDQSLDLEPQDTEIPKLQEVLKNLNKSINRKLTRDYVNEAKGVLSLIQSYLLDRDEKMTKAKVRKELEKNMEVELNVLACHFDSLYRILDQYLSNGVVKSVNSCVATLQTKINSVKPLNHQTFSAVCKRGGCYWPKNWDEPLDLNKCLTKHMYENIDKEFESIFLVGDHVRTGKSVQEQLDKFSIIKSSYPRSSLILHHIENFIKTEETKLKTSLNRKVVDRKKEIYSSIETVIQNAMATGYKEVVKVKGNRCMERRMEMLIKTIESLKGCMFIEAKKEMLKKFIDLKLYIMKTLESELKKSVEWSFLQTSKITHLDVSREIEELERFLQQLSD